MGDLPQSVYFVVGILVVGNLSAIAAFVVFIFKCGVFVANTQTGITIAKDMAVRAHKRIDKLEE